MHDRPALELHEREIVLRVIAAASFLIFFQSYLVAPLIPSLAIQFGASQALVGLLVPAYMLPYGISTLFYGPLSDRIGRRVILLTLLGAMVVTTLLSAGAMSAGQLLACRLLSGVAAGGIIPIGIAQIGDLFAYKERGRALGWIFGAIAGGSALGSTLGALLNPYLGWRVLLLLIGVATAFVFGVAVRHRGLLQSRGVANPPKLPAIIRGYWWLIRHPRASRGYSFITLNGMFHSGIFSWLGLYFVQRYGLTDPQIGLALLGYGLPGLLLGPLIGRLADRIGRRWVIPTGLLVSAFAGAALIPHWPLLWPCVVATVLSLGFDMSHPLLTGIITSVDADRRGQALGLNAFVLFSGFGLGSLVFQGLLMHRGFGFALTSFAIAEVGLAIAGFVAFRHEVAERAHEHH